MPDKDKQRFLQNELREVSHTDFEIFGTLFGLTDVQSEREEYGLTEEEFKELEKACEMLSEVQETFKDFANKLRKKNTSS